MATKKNSSSPGTTRSRTKKTAESTNETAASTPETLVSTTSGGTAVALAREKTTTGSGNNRPNFNYPADVQNRIRQRAYELFQQRGGQHGFDVQDWLRAEAELKQR